MDNDEWAKRSCNIYKWAPDLIWEAAGKTIGGKGGIL
jgi:hypothetical protein